MIDDPKDPKDPNASSSDLVPSQPVPAQPALPFTGGLGVPGPTPAPGIAFGLQVTNAEAEIVKKVTPEHITKALDNAHQRELRRFDLAEKELADTRAEAERHHQRDERARRTVSETDGRYERILYVLLGVVVVAAIALVVGGKSDDAYRLFTDFLKVALGFVGGIGVATARQRRRDSNDE